MDAQAEEMVWRCTCGRTGVIKYPDREFARVRILRNSHKHAYGCSLTTELRWAQRSERRLVST